MTWIIGTPAAFGFAIGFSDIRVTFESGRTSDCLRKIFHVGNDVLAGFAGNVKLGFALIHSLAQFLSAAGHDEAWNPEAIAAEWPRIAKDVAYDFVPSERSAEVMILAVHPSADLGAPVFPRPYVYTLRTPSFEPRLARVGQFVSIGSGSSQQKYLDALESVRTNPFYDEMIMVPNGIQVSLAHALSRTIRENPEDSVSHHLHIGTVRRGGCAIMPFHEEDITGKGKDSVIMPTVANNYDEFVRGIGGPSLAANAVAQPLPNSP